MKCPFCQDLDNKVVDSRLTKDNTVIRRRRECLACGRRFTTYEDVEDIQPYVVKSDGTREPYDRQKVLTGIKLACNKRPVSVNDRDVFIDDIEAQFREHGIREIPTKEIGERVIEWLREQDDVAYVRFASVYRRFEDINDFMNAFDALVTGKSKREEDADSRDKDKG